MISKSKHTVIKFTRMYCKVRALWEIDPEVKFIHIVRDPRAVTTSYLFGKNQKNRDRFPNEKSFFERKSSKSSWYSFPFSEFGLNAPEYSHLKGCDEDFMRTLILWKYKFRKTHDAGKQLFRNNYLLLRHEDLLSVPRQTMKLLYDFLGRALPQHVIDWTLEHVRSSHACYAPDNLSWRRAFKKLNMNEELAIAGYSCPTSWHFPKDITIKRCLSFWKLDNRQ